MSVATMQRKNILWLVSWYPNITDPFDGDFIQRHAKAAAIHHNIHVLFVKAVTDAPVPDNELRRMTGLTEEIIYYNNRTGLVGKITNLTTWRRLYMQAINRFVWKTGPPDVVHVHIPWKAGLIALELKTTKGWPYIITEHWGVYNPKVPDNITTKKFLVKQLWKKIFFQAAGIVSVSDYLGKGINKYLVKKPFLVIPNVVDTSLFYHSQEKHTTFTFIHVSNMVPLKGVNGILEAFHKLVLSGCDQCRLILIGNRDETYVQKARSMGLLGKQVFFKGEIPYVEVAAEMRQAHCLVVNSTIENAPCVISEALCCGLPVIATKVGGIPEMITKENGMLIKSKATKELTTAMQKMLSEYAEFNKKQIAKMSAAKFGYGPVADAFRKLYQ